MRKGLVKKIVSVTRGGKSFQQTVWVKPKEFAAQKSAKKLAQYEKERAAGGAKPIRLKDSPWKYFEKPKGAKLVPLNKLDTTSTRKVGIHNAAKFMSAAYKGKRAKRKPITVTKLPNGRYKVLDGNSTTNVAQQNKWKALPVIEVSAEEAAKIQAADKEKKAGKAEGAERIKRREEVMTKFRRQAPGRGYEAKPTEEEVAAILDVGRFAIVSAGKNPNLEADMTPEQEQERHERLREKLVAEGFQFTQVKGHYFGEEDSFLVWVHDADRETANSLGEEFNQDSVIFGENGSYELHFTTGDRARKMETVDHWEPRSQEETNLYTEVPLAGGGTYRFKFPFTIFDDDKSKERDARILAPYKKGSRREFLHGVDEEGLAQEQFRRYSEARNKRR